MASRSKTAASAGPPLATVTSDDINYLVYRYLQESGFVHSAFSFGYESYVNKLNINGAEIPPGALVSFLQKGLQYCEIESQLASEAPDDEILPPTTLVQAAIDMVSGVRRKPKAKRQRTKGASKQATAETSVEVSSDELRVLEGHKKEVFVCAWNPHDQLLASGSGDSSARIWDLTSKSGSSVILDHHLGGTDAAEDGSASKDITTLDWNADGTKLATGCYDGLGRVWSKDGTLVTTLRAHKGPIFSLKWNKRGNYLLSGSVDKTAIIWDAVSGQVKQQFSCQDGATLDVDWRDDESFASCSTDNHIYVCQLGSDQPLRRFSGHKDEVNAVKWDPTGTLLASCSDDCTAKVWQVDADKCALDLRGVGKGGHSKEIYSIKWSPTGPGTAHANRPLLLASASFDTTVKLWDVHHGGKCYATFQGHQDPIYSIAFSPTGEYLVSGSIDNSLMIWSVKDGELLKRYRGGGEIFEVAWNAEGTKVAACFSNSTVATIDFRKL
eukprot:SAG31_NODE_594_length_13670_cov_2.624642_5_plen_497_part_00